MAKIRATTLPAVDANKRIIVVNDGGVMKAVKIKDKLVEIDISGLAGTGVSKLGYFSTWREFNTGMSDSRNHGKLFYIENMEGRDGIPAGESGIVYMFDGTTYFSDRSWLKTKKYVDDEVKKLYSKTEIDTMLGEKAEEIDMVDFKNDVSGLIDKVDIFESQLNQIENTWTGTKAGTIWASTATFHLIGLTGDKGAFDFTAGKKTFLKLKNPEGEKLFEIKAGDTDVLVTMGTDVVKASLSITGELKLVHVSTGDSHNLSNIDLVEVEQNPVATATAVDAYTKLETDNKLNLKVDTTTLASYDTTVQVDAKLTTKLDESKFTTESAKKANTNLDNLTYGGGIAEGETLGLYAGAGNQLSLFTVYSVTDADAKFETIVDSNTKLRTKMDETNAYTKVQADAKYETKADITTKLATKQDTLTRTITITYDDGTTETVKVG